MSDPTSDDLARMLVAAMEDADHKVLDQRVKVPVKWPRHEAIVTDAYRPIAWCRRCWERWPCPDAPEGAR